MLRLTGAGFILSRLKAADVAAFSSAAPAVVNFRSAA